VVQTEAWAKASLNAPWPPNYIVVAANRDIEHATSQELTTLAQGAGSRLIVVKVDASTDSDALEAVKELKKQGVDHLDLVIANAGVSYAFGKVSDIKIAEIKGHFEPNVYGVVRLYQATVPLLRESANATWVTIGSTAGSIEVGLPVNLHLRRA
jgi:NADP-dependent 3-hydroxy acid dehydrogenase YdfG